MLFKNKGNSQTFLETRKFKDYNTHEQLLKELPDTQSQTIQR